MYKIKKKYQLTLSCDYSGEVVVEARTRKEAEEKGENIIDNTTPYWFEYGCQSVDKIRVFNKKTHIHEYEFGTGKCICGRIKRI